MIKNKKVAIGLIACSIFTIVSSSNISFANEVDKPNENVSAKGEVSARILATAGVVVADELNVRSGPGTNYSAIDSISRGHEVFAKNFTDGWWYIIYEDGGQTKSGWASAQYIALAP